MSTSIQKLPGIAFLPFQEMDSLLTSELRSRFNITEKPQARYGDLQYYELPEKTFLIETQTSPSPKYPYWARTTMLSPFILRFDSIGEAAGELKKYKETGHHTNIHVSVEPS